MNSSNNKKERYNKEKKMKNINNKTRKEKALTYKWEISMDLQQIKVININ